MDEEDIKGALRSVLLEDSMMELLAKAFEKLLNKVTDRVEKLAEKDANKEDRLTRVEERLDREAQDSRGCNIVITGLNKAELAKEKMVEKMNECMDCNLQVSDIKWVQKLVADEESIKRCKSKLRVVFKEQD